MCILASDGEVLKFYTDALMDEIADGFDAQKHPVVTYIQWGFVSFSIAAPELVQDLYVTRNEQLVLTGALEVVFKKLMSQSF